MITIHHHLQVYQQAIAHIERARTERACTECKIVLKDAHTMKMESSVLQLMPSMFPQSTQICSLFF